jgi:hypothetical protein
MALQHDSAAAAAQRWRNGQHAKSNSIELQEMSPGREFNSRPGSWIF